MNVSPIISPDGEQVFTAGGADAWRQFQHRGFVVSLEWARRRRTFLKMMVIWKAGSLLSVGTAVKPGMWAISSRAIVDFVGFNREGRCNGSASEHCFREALAAMPELGLDPNDKHGFTALVDTVVKFAPDLMMMPIAPKAVKREMTGEAIWEVTATNKHTGKTISEAAV